MVVVQLRIETPLLRKAKLCKSFRPITSRSRCVAFFVAGAAPCKIYCIISELLYRRMQSGLLDDLSSRALLTGWLSIALS
jgi:hypothetical protein